MNLNRMTRLALTFSFACLLCMPSVASADTEFYVDSGRSSSGDGSAANPWKERGDIDWARISAALANNPVTVYFSSRGTWNTDQYINVPSNANTTTRWLTLDGHSRYNLTAGGTATWQAESVPNNRAHSTVSVAGASGGSIFVTQPNRYIAIKGFKVTLGRSGGIVLGMGNPVTDINNILIENNDLTGHTLDSAGQGISGVFLETGCYNITVRGNTIQNFLSEAIYIGHFSYSANTITGTIIEYNTVLNNGLTVQGDIDIKSGNYGAIVRYNTVSATNPASGVTAGIVIAADAVQVYGNRLFNLNSGPNSDGDGIQVNGDQGDAPTKEINDVLIYNNLIYGVASNGINLIATRTDGAEPSGIQGIKILNNTIVSNGGSGVRISTVGDHTISVAEMHNNIFASNGGPAVNVLTSGGTILAADHNLLFDAGTLAVYQGVNKTWDQWQALGFDLTGVNADPQLDPSLMPTTASPVIDRGVGLSEFTNDIANRPRQAPWDIGAYEYDAASRQTAPPSNLRLVP